MKKTIEEVLLKATEGVAKMDSISHPEKPKAPKTWQQFKRRDGRISTDSMQIDRKLYEEIQWDAAAALVAEIDQLRTQLATAEQTGYERGVREAAMCEVSVSPIRPNETSAGYQLRVRDDMQQSILNLLNKKGTE